MPPDLPRLVISSFPEEERALARSIWQGLCSLGTYVDSFGEALSLFQFTQQQMAARHSMQPMSPEAATQLRLLAGWSFVAARDGAMSIYHFLCAMEGIKACVHRGPTIKPYFNGKTSREATKLFSARFPRCEEMRHAIAHAAELVESPEKFEENSFSGSYDDGAVRITNSKNIMISNHLNGDVYSTTINGQIISYAINDVTRTSLIEVRSKLYSAFEV